MATKIELSAARALEALGEIESTILCGDRPSVTVSDMDGLSPQFVERLMLREDVDLTLSEKAASQFAVDANDESPTRTGGGAFYYAATALAALIACGAGLMLML